MAGVDGTSRDHLRLTATVVALFCAGFALELLATALNYTVGRWNVADESLSLAATCLLLGSAVALFRRLDRVDFTVPLAAFLLILSKCLDVTGNMDMLCRVPVIGRDDPLNKIVENVAFASGILLVLGRLLLATLEAHNARLDLASKHDALVRETEEHTRAEEALRESEEKYRTLVESAGEVIAVLDESGVFLFMNRVAAEQLGGKPEDLIGRTAWDLFPQEFADRHVEAVRRVITSGQGAVVDNPTVVGGATRWYRTRLTPLKAADGGPTTALVFASDITERKRAEEALDKSETRFRALVETSSDWIWEVDANGVYTYASPVCKDLLGYEPEEVIGKTPFDFMPPGEARVVAAVFRGITAAHEPFERLENVNLHRSGRLVVLETSGVPILDAHGHLLGYRGVDRDITERVLAVQALQESEERYHAIFRQAADSIVLIDAETGSPVEFNESAHESLGYTREEFEKLNIRDVVVLESADQIAKRFEKMIKEGPEVFEAKHRTKSGEIRDVQVSAQSIALSGKHFIMASSRDVTEQKRIQNALVESEERLRVLMQNMPVGLYRSTPGPEGRFLMANPAAARMHGYETVEEFLQVPVNSLYWDPAERRAFSDKLLAEGLLMAEELRLKKRDGTPFGAAVTARVVRDETGGVKYFDGMIEDITERKQAQDARIRLETAIEQAGEAVAIMDRGWRIVYANPTFEAVTGYSRDEAIGRVLQAVAGDPHHQALYRDVTDTVERGEVWQGRLSAKKRDETIYQAEATLSPVRNAAGQIVNFVCVWRDVTHEVALEAQLRHAQKMLAIGTLAGGIAHKFRNILSSIVGFSEIALKHVEKGSVVEKCLTHIAAGADRGADVVRRIMKFSRQEETVRRPMDIGAVVSEAIDLLRASVPPTIEFRQDIDPACRPVLADPGEIHQVVLELGANAFHAMSEHGGVFEVSLRQVESLPEHLALAPGRYVQLSASDTGHGIPREAIERVFEPFFTTKSSEEGTGLGLAGVHRTVENLGGAIEVHSEVGKGTEFTLFFPVCDKPDEASEETLADESHLAGCERVLVVDDDASIVIMAEMGLESLGYTVEGFTDSLKALDAFRDKPDAFDVVIVDQVMLGLTGTDLAREITGIRPDIAIILCTGFSEEVDEQKAKEAGVAEYLVKPVGPSELARAIRRVRKEDRSRRA